MRPETLKISRREGIDQTRKLLDENGDAVDMSGWAGTFDANYLSQLHGKSDEAFSVSTTTTDQGESSAVIGPEVIEDVTDTSVLVWHHLVVPDVLGSLPILLGWGVLELLP